MVYCHTTSIKDNVQFQFHHARPDRLPNRASHRHYDLYPRRILSIVSRHVHSLGEIHALRVRLCEAYGWAYYVCRYKCHNSRRNQLVILRWQGTDFFKRRLRKNRCMCCYEVYSDVFRYRQTVIMIYSILRFTRSLFFKNPIGWPVIPLKPNLMWNVKTIARLACGVHRYSLTSGYSLRDLRILNTRRHRQGVKAFSW